MNESPGLLPLFSDLPTLVLQGEKNCEDRGREARGRAAREQSRPRVKGACATRAMGKCNANSRPRAVGGGRSPGTTSGAALAVRRSSTPSPTPVYDSVIAKVAILLIHLDTNVSKA